LSESFLVVIVGIIDFLGSLDDFGYYIISQRFELILEMGTNSIVNASNPFPEFGMVVIFHRIVGSMNKMQVTSPKV
jgi:hypothetical protein